MGSRGVDVQILAAEMAQDPETARILHAFVAIWV
jgi:hypothetical protein